MAHTFEVFPSRAVELKPAAVGELATSLLRDYLAGFPIEHIAPVAPGLAGEVHQRLGACAARVGVTLEATASEPLPASLGTDVPSEPEAVAFATRPGAGGGLVQRLAFGSGQTPAAWWKKDLEPRLDARGLRDRFERCRGLGYHFEVVRTLGQPALAALAHGFVAAAIAELSDGIVASPDGAWDEAVCPCTARDFLGSYMRPDGELGEQYRIRTERRMRELPGELALFDADLVGRIRESVIDRLVTDLETCRGQAEPERQAFERALQRLETTRVLGATAPEEERRLIVGDRRADRSGKPSAFDRLNPTPAELERWMDHLGELMF